MRVSIATTSEIIFLAEMTSREEEFREYMPGQLAKEQK